jgi:hypothetical protein
MGTWGRWTLKEEEMTLIGLSPWRAFPYFLPYLLYESSLVDPLFQQVKKDHI